MSNRKSVIDTSELNLIEIVNRLLDIGRLLESGPLLSGIGQRRPQRCDRSENHARHGNEMTPRCCDQHLVQPASAVSQRSVGGTRRYLQFEHRRRCLLRTTLQRSKLKLEFRNVTYPATSERGEVRLRRHEF